MLCVLEQMSCQSLSQIPLNADATGITINLGFHNIQLGVQSSCVVISQRQKLGTLHDGGTACCVDEELGVTTIAGLGYASSDPSV